MTPSVAVVCGGVGAARYLAGLVQVVDPGSIVAIVNTGDDTDLHGLRICPDLDTITYTLSGRVNPETGWGLAGDSFQTMEALAAIGGEAWFRLGNLDLATHLYRTGRLQAGATLSEVTAELGAAYGVGLRLLPMSDDAVRTVLRLAGGGDAGEGDVSFQDYFVRLRHSVAVAGVRFEGAETAVPAPGVLEALSEAPVVVIAPSNPVVSIDPVLAVPGIRSVLEGRRSSVVGVSPIVGGAALKGPADRLLEELGSQASVAGVARWLSSVCGTLVVDTVDAAAAGDVEAAGMRCLVTDTVMTTREVSAALARTTLAAAAESVGDHT